MLNFVWLPGWSYTADIFRHIIQNLDDALGVQNHILVDFSDCISPESLPETVMKILESIDEKPIIIGWSLGAMVAQKVLEVKPQTAELIFLISTSPSFIQTSAYPDGIPKKTLASLRRLVSINADQAVIAFRSSIHTENGRRECLLGKCCESEIPPKKSLLAGLDFLAQYAINAKACTDVYVPVYLLHGALDSICHPQAMRRMCSLYKNARLEVINNIGHDIIFSSPNLMSDRIADAITELEIL